MVSLQIGFDPPQATIEGIPGRCTSDTDIRNQPAYPLGEAARYLRLPPATLRSWTVGRPYPTAKGKGHFERLIHPAGAKPPLLSFWNLVEAHVVRALRTDHGISIGALRTAIAYAERKLGIKRLLLSKDLCSDAGQLFLDRYGELINLSASGQLAMRQVLLAHLKRIVWDRQNFPLRLHPFLVSDGMTSDISIAIDPSISFGRPVVTRAGVSTAAIVARIDAGESVVDVAKDYGLTNADVEKAVLYERAA